MKVISSKTIQKAERTIRKARLSKKERLSNTEDEFYLLLDNVKTALKQGWTVEALRDNLKNLYRIVRGNSEYLRTKDEFNYLKSVCLIAEAYDYLGERLFAKEAISEGEEELEKLKKPDTVVHDRRIIRERIRLGLDYAYITFYRFFDYDRARDEVLWCRNFVMQRLMTEDFPCLGTLAKADNQLGRIYMRKNEYEQAEACFDQAGRYYEMRAERMKKYCKDNLKLQEELIFSEHKSGLCLGLGLGWTNFLKGQLKTALRNNVTPARMMLKRTDDALHIAYLDLLEGSIMRSLAGRLDKEKLEEAIIIIQAAHKVFKHYEHGPYTARAAYELSLAYLYNNELEKAASEVTEMETVSENISESEKDKKRWGCQALIVRSRIERASQKYVEALALAIDAFNWAKDTNQVLYQIEALITQGEARMMLGKIEDARANFQEALKLNTEPGLDGEEKQANPKLEATCNLHLARSYIKERKLRLAEDHFKRWSELRGQIEHCIIQEIALDVEREIRELKQDFLIPADTPDLTYETHRKALQQFLVERALSRDKTNKEIAQVLHISRQTLYKWRDTNPKIRALLGKSEV